MPLCPVLKARNMIDDGQAKLIILAMIAIMGAIGASGLVTALRTGKTYRRATPIERETNPGDFRRAILTRGLLLGLMAVTFVVYLIFY